MDMIEVETLGHEVVRNTIEHPGLATGNDAEAQEGLMIQASQDPTIQTRDIFSQLYYPTSIGAKWPLAPESSSSVLRLLARR